MAGRWRWMAGLFIGGLVACASNTESYTPPMASSVATERTINQPFDAAWDAYVAELSKSFFVITSLSNYSDARR